MSLFGKILGAAAPIIGGALGGPVGAAIGGAVGGIISPQPSQVAAQIPIPRSARPGLQTFVPPPPPSLPGAGQVEPAMSKVPQIARRAQPLVTEVLTGQACPKGYHLDKKTRSYCVKNRRMNPLNGRAAMRAIRRIKGARRMLQKIERSLPKQRVTRRAPAGHRRRLEHQ